MSSIELNAVAKSWDQVIALHSLQLRIAPGSFCVLLGPSGCGKSTTLRIIAGLETATSGQVMIDHLLPDAAVLDPRLTASLPPRITASTGMDALSHAIEGYTCIQTNPLSRAYALAAMQLIQESLIPCVQNGKDEALRMALANASLMAGAAFSNSMVGLVHAIGHALGGVSSVPHGDAMNILLPHCMAYNSRAKKGLYADLLPVLAGENACLQTPMDKRDAAAILAVENMQFRLKELCGQPITLRDARVKEEDLERVAHTALNDGALLMNPVEADFNDILNILKKAY